MKVEVHVSGEITYGGMPGFHEAVGRYKKYAEAHGYAVPDVLLGLSGKMNTIRLVYHFEDLNQYGEQEARTLDDREYGEIAGKLGFTPGTLGYEIYQRI